MTPMRDFFKREFETLEIKTGIRQYERMMERDNWEADFRLAIDLMVDECNKPPFDLIGIDLKQRIISQAIIEDKDFIGLNPKFVRKALATWWNFNKDKYYEQAVQNAQEQQTAEPVSWKEREHWLNVWRAELDKLETSVKKVPQLTEKEIQEEGQERPKQKIYPSAPLSQHLDNAVHDAWIRDCHDKYSGKPNERWMPEDQWRKENAELIEELKKKTAKQLLQKL
jgi:hypothetical protein